MPRRRVILANGELYHVYNLAIDRKPIFKSKRNFQRIAFSLWFFRYVKRPCSFSTFLNSGQNQKRIFLDQLKDSEVSVKIISFCLMSNHFHFLIKQIRNNGISKYLSDIQNSYTRYFNFMEKRKGSIFHNQFKATRIETDEQLLHVSRYIHLNPYTGYLVKTISDLIKYPWSSLSQYLGESNNKYQFCSTDIILDYFQNKADYRDFVLNQAEYQRELDKIKHLVHEE